MSNEIVLYGPNGQPYLNVDREKEEHDTVLSKLLWLRTNARVQCPHCKKQGRCVPNIWNRTLTCAYEDCHQAFEVDPLTCPIFDPEGQPLRRFPEDLGVRAWG